MKRGLIFCGLMIAWFGSDGQSSMAARTAIATNLPDNATKTITPALLRTSLTAMVDLVDQKVSSQWQNQTGNYISFPGYAKVAMMRLDAYNAASLAGFPAGNTGMLAYQNDGTKGLYLNDGTSFKRVSPWMDGVSGIIAYDGDLKIGSTGNMTLGKGNSSVGTNTGFGVNVLSATTIGSDNTGIGHESMKANQNGYWNTAIGASSLKAGVNTTNNVAVGYNSQMSNVSGANNTAVGSSALISNLTGNWNTAIGQNALGATKGNSNTGVGYSAGNGINTGIKNTLVGSSTGGGLVSGSNNTIIGASVGGLAENLSNNIIIADGEGNQRINVDATGNVGIGSDAVIGVKLKVNGGIQTNKAGESGMVFNGMNGLPASFIAVDGTGKVIRAPIPENITDVGVGTDGENTISVYRSNNQITPEVTLLSEMNSKNVAALRALNNSPYKAVYIPELKGFYYHDTTDNTSVDDNKNVIVTADAKRYKSLRDKYTKTFNKPMNYFADSIVVNQSEHQVISPEMVTMRSETGVMMLPYKINSTSKRVVVYFNKDKAYKGSFTIF
jgi:hypothetical protein